MMSRDGGHKSRLKSRKIYYPGDILQVNSREELPGWPHSVDGWEFVGEGSLVEGVEGNLVQAPNPKKQYTGIQECLEQAVLKYARVRGDSYKVSIAEPGLNYVNPDGTIMTRGTKLHPGFITEERARSWVELGYDPEGE